MRINHFRCFLNPALIALAIAIPATSAVAQPEEMPAQSEEKPELKTASDIEEADSERAADLRDAINENLVEPRKSIEEPEVEPEEPDMTTSDEPEETHWYQRFEKTTGRVQNIADEIPFLKGKGWVHFGRIEAEYGYMSGGSLEGESGFNFRSLRGGFTRRFNDRTMVKLEIDATDGDSNWVDLWGRVTTRFGVFTVGNQRVAQTLVNQTSRLSRTFLEVPLPADAFGLGRRLGVGWDFHLRKIGSHLTVFGKDLNEQIGKLGYGGRFYYNPKLTRFSMVHIGVSAIHEKMDRDAQFRAYPETRVPDLRLVDTGRQSSVNDQTIAGLELATARKSMSFRSEIFKAKWHREELPDSTFDGYYAQLNWAITGESFNYAQGKFLRVRPNNHIGAFELAGRYSHIDLNDGDIQGGEQTNTSLALNWYGPGRQLRVQSSVIHVDVHDNPNQSNSIVYQFRVQVHW